MFFLISFYPEQLHVHDSLSLDGFVSTAQRHPSDTSCPGVYSLDCEMVISFFYFYFFGGL